MSVRAFNSNKQQNSNKMESKKINTSYEVEVSRDCFDLDKESVTEVVFKTESMRKAFARMAKIATEVCRDGFRPYSSALFAMVFEKGEGKGRDNRKVYGYQLRICGQVPVPGNIRQTAERLHRVHQEHCGKRVINLKNRRLIK